MKDENREYGLRIRVNRAEYEYLNKEAERSGMVFANGRVNMSAYLRNLILQESRYENRHLIQELKNLNYEMRKIGVNINQIAHRVNSGCSFPGDIPELIKLLEAAGKRMEALEEGIKKGWQSQS